MKKSIVLVLIFILITGTCYAANYTLPEKMYNQLAIGSGLKGSFSISKDGTAFDSPFLNAVADAEWSVRGIRSGEDLHYYVFQSNGQEEQTALSELYRKEGTYYFRSDMVQGQILAFPILSQYLDAFFPSDGENGTSSSFISKIISLPDNIRKEKWDPVLLRYQNELEMWLADFTVTADTVKMENGLSALDFTYEIPMENVNAQIVKLFGEFATDPEVVSLFETVMTQEEKDIYLNGNLLYFYLDALTSLQIDRPVRMSKRVSAIGDLLRFRLELPLDERTTGYKSIDIETVNQLTVITMKKTGQIRVIAFPDIEKLKQASFEQSIWYACINADPEKEKDNLAIKLDIVKNDDVYDKDEKTYDDHHYVINIQQDTTYLPEDTDLSLLPAFQEINMRIDLKYSSKYAQNSATTLEISAEINQNDSSLKIEGKLKTAAPWLFMPFEIIDPIQVGTEKEKVFDPYMTDWISNADSIIHHISNETEPADQTDESPSDKQESQPASDSEINNETDGESAETVPLTETAQE